MMLSDYIRRQKAWSLHTFGPGARTIGILRHIHSELAEISEAPADVEEWCDVVILALDGAWRAGHSAEAIVAALRAKQAKNFARQWPAVQPEDQPTEHVREATP